MELHPKIQIWLKLSKKQRKKGAQETPKKKNTHTHSSSHLKSSHAFHLNNSHARHVAPFPPKMKCQQMRRSNSNERANVPGIVYIPFHVGLIKVVVFMNVIHREQLCKWKMVNTLWKFVFDLASHFFSVRSANTPTMGYECILFRYFESFTFNLGLRFMLQRICTMNTPKKKIANGKHREHLFI